MAIIFNRRSRDSVETDFTSEKISRRTNDENTKCGRSNVPPTRGTTSRVSTSSPKRDLNFTNATVCRVRPHRASRCGRGTNSADPSEPNNTEEAYGEPAEILSKLSFGDRSDTVVIYDGVTIVGIIIIIGREKEGLPLVPRGPSRISVQEFKFPRDNTFFFPLYIYIYIIYIFRFFSRFSFFKNR